MAFWIFALIVIVAAFLAIATLLLPKLFLHNKCALTGSCDRGIKSTTDKRGKSVLYEPSPVVRKYIKKYVLTEHEGSKLLVCMLTKRFKYLDYDIVVFDNDNNVRCILNVKEVPKETGYTRVIKLPDEAAYVSLNINGANEAAFSGRVLSRVSVWRVVIFALCSAILVAATVVGIKICCNYIFGGLFSESLMVEGGSTLFTVIIGSVVAAVDLVVTLVLVLIKNNRGARKKERKTV